MRFSVWAPEAESVALETWRGRHAMERGEQGWWEVETEAGVGSDYRYLVDGEGPYPDPRSPWQPEGPHGPSRVAAVRAPSPGWRVTPWERAVVYELHVGTFSPDGTFAAAEQRLDHLVELGVTHLEVMPVAEFPGERGWGYDGVALYAPHHAYGGPEGFAHLVDAAHGRGLGVILDVVYNHLGPDGNYLGVYGPYFTDRYRTPWGEAVNVDGAWSDEVRDFFVDNALHWLETYGVDGLRLDAVHAITDQSAYPFLEHLSGVVDAFDAATGRRSVLVAEDNRNDARMVRPVGRGGMGLEAMWADDLHHGLHVALTGETDGYYCDYRGMADAAVALRRGYVFDGSRYSPYRRRTPGRPPGGLPPHALVVALQNHDQVGNRARGDRITDLADHDRVRGAAALVLLAPQVPMIFQGEEWAASTPFQYFTDHQDPELGRAVSEGRADEFASFAWQGEVPDPQAEETFRRSRLQWEERERPPHAAMLDWYRRLVALRATPGLSTWPEVSSGEGWLVMDRGALVVAVNLGQRGVTAAIDGPLAEVMSAGGATLHQPGSLDLPPGSVAVLGRT